MSVTKIGIALSILLNLPACSSLSIKEKVLRNAIIASAAGYALGSQKENNQNGYGTMYAGVAAAVVSTASIYYYDPDQEIESFKNKTIELARSLDNFGDSSRRYTKSINGSSTLKSFGNMPEKYRNLVNPGDWRIYAIDDWEQIDETRLVHKTEILEINPPKLNVK